MCINHAAKRTDNDKESKLVRLLLRLSGMHIQFKGGLDLWI